MLFLFCCNLFAQNKTITGTVTDDKGETLIGVSVMAKGTNVGTVTDLDGNYSLSVPNNAKTLISTYLGMKDTETPINGSVVNITMGENLTDLDEVVVIGYGVVKKRDLTGSVSSVEGKALKDIPVSTAAEAITGRLAGVQVTTTEGSPDAEIKIRVRGGGSITGDNTPLYIVDGFPVNSIADISPNDIQSIDVLKDASSTAIYGSRGANGVIIVTTKAPKEGKFSINYSGYLGFKKIAKTLDVLNPYEFAKWQYEQAAIQKGTKVQDQYVPYFGVYEDMGIYKSINGTDWQDEIFGRTGTSSNHNISISGGTDKISYNANYNRTDDKAIMIQSDYYRNSLNLKLNIKPIKGLKIAMSTRFTETKATGAGANDTKSGKATSSDTRLKHTVIYSPIKLRNITSDSDDEEELGSLYPPYQIVNDNYRNKRNRRYNFNGSVSYEIIKGLTVQVEGGLDDEYIDDNRYFGASTDYLRNKANLENYKIEGGAASMVGSTERTLRNTNTITYTKKDLFAKDHNFSAMLGQETLSTQRTVQTKTAEGIDWSISPKESFYFMSSAVNLAEISNFRYRDQNLLSFFGRINYDYAGKYLVTATFREDGSSRFLPGSQQWGFFPSVAVAWRASDEDFLKDKKWLSNLKWRASYGTAGNNKIDGNYEHIYNAKNTGYLNMSKSYWDNGTRLPMENLTWETTHTRNIGIDYGFLNGRISGAVDLYYNTTKDLLLDMAISGTGYVSMPINAGETSNKGIELSINTIILDKKDFGLDFNFNIGFNKNKVESLGGLPMIQAASGWNSQVAEDYRVIKGRSLGLMYGYVTDGFYSVDDFVYNGTKWELVNQSPTTPDNSSNTGAAWGPGALKLKDLNKDGKIDEKDMTIIGNATPKFTGGFSINARYKGFDLAANFTFVYGNDIYNANKLEFTSNNSGIYKYRNMITEMSSDKRWTSVDPNTGAVVTDAATLKALNKNATIWSPYNRFLFHSWAVEDGSFLRLNNLTIGYTLPRALTQKVSLQNVRFYATASNLFVITNYSGYDPEVDSRRKTQLTPGVDYSAYPKSRGYNFGVNVTF